MREVPLLGGWGVDIGVATLKTSARQPRESELIGPVTITAMKKAK
jgi:hypothetical protein